MKNTVNLHSIQFHKRLDLFFFLSSDVGNGNNSGLDFFSSVFLQVFLAIETFLMLVLNDAGNQCSICKV